MYCVIRFTDVLNSVFVATISKLNKIFVTKIFTFNKIMLAIIQKSLGDIKTDHYLWH